MVRKRLVPVLILLILLLPLLYIVATMNRAQRVIIAFVEAPMDVENTSRYYSKATPKPYTLVLQYDSPEPIKVDDLELFGYIVVYFDHEIVSTILVDQLRERRTISIDLSSAIEKSRERYEVANKLLYSRVRGPIRLPTLGIAVFLFDENGYMYIDSWTLSAYKYNLLIKQLDPKTAVEDALRNPYGYLEEGLLVVIDPKILSKRLTTKIDLEAWFEHIDQASGVNRKNIGFALQQHQTIDAESASWCGDFCRDTYWVELARTYNDPPYWYTYRVTIENVQYPDYYKMQAWNRIVERFSQATNYAKDRYSLREAFYKFLNDVDGINWYCRFYDVRRGNYTAFVSDIPAVFIKECGAIPSYARVGWNDTFPRNTLLEVYKPYLVFYHSQRNYKIILSMNQIEFGYVKKGITFFSRLVFGEEYATMFEAEIIDVFSKNDLDELGAIGGGFIIPSWHLYFQDRILVVFYPRTRTIGSREYWSFIPVMIFYPEFLEGEAFLEAVSVRFNPFIITCTCITSSATNTTCTSWYYCSRLLNRSIYEILLDLAYAKREFYNSTPACNISRYWPTLMDQTSSSRLTVEDGAIIFYILKTFVDTLFDVPGGEPNPATILLKFFINSIGYADLTMNFALRTFRLYVKREFNDCNYVLITIHKNFHYSATYRGLGNATINEVPLAGYYEIDPLPWPPPCDHPIACPIGSR